MKAPPLSSVLSLNPVSSLELACDPLVATLQLGIGSVNSAQKSPGCFTGEFANSAQKHWAETLLILISNAYESSKILLKVFLLGLNSVLLSLLFGKFLRQWVS